MRQMSSGFTILIFDKACRVLWLYSRLSFPIMLRTTRFYGISLSPIRLIVLFAKSKSFKELRPVNGIIDSMWLLRQKSSLSWGKLLAVSVGIIYETWLFSRQWLRLRSCRDYSESWFCRISSDPRLTPRRFSMTRPPNYESPATTSSWFL